MFSRHFDILISKLNLKKFKNIILIYFKIKNILKNNNYYNTKLALNHITNFDEFA